MNGMTESKLDETVLDGEISIDGYESVRSDRNRHGDIIDIISEVM